MFALGMTGMEAFVETLTLGTIIWSSVYRTQM